MHLNLKPCQIAIFFPNAPNVPEHVILNDSGSKVLTLAPKLDKVSMLKVVCNMTMDGLHERGFYTFNVFELDNFPENTTLPHPV